ncbi:GGDEF and EAL domain-containing protein [Shewanella mesophila]|uniref:putative bifunctional diguanylate cyclase/phosphodiesterase n=1 Tax=Shewanella mesophila TaxID=2864208 RepID=UPI001C66086D|nr:EAL domain-containing protein [Shewanella mesophila]QYJ86100.1 GGDEF and EAL domain-containing protein [Shewanella mesophila]
MQKLFVRPSLLLFTPLVCILLFVFFLTVSYYVERNQHHTDVYNGKIDSVSQMLTRMNHLVSLASESQSFSRVEEEISLSSSDIWMAVYTLIDRQGNIRFANHAVWRDSSASLVIDGYLKDYHHEAVDTNTPLIKFNEQRQSIQAYFPIFPAVSSLSVERPELIYLEYDVSPALMASDKNVLLSLIRIGLIALGIILVLLAFIYRYVLRPLRQISQQSSEVNGEEVPVSNAYSPFIELESLADNLSYFKDKYLSSTQQLKDSEQRWLFAVEVSRYGIWDWNILDDSVFLSDRWKDMLGYKPYELSGSLLTWQSRLHPDDKKSTLDTLSGYLSGKTEEFESVHRLRHKQGHYIWVLDRGMTVEWDAQGRPLRMIGTLSDVTDDIRNQKAASRQVKHDLLTDLANRRALMDELYDLEKESDSCAALFMIDLDNFKVVNDVLGHHGGDRLLIQIAARLSSYFSVNSLIARLAADEFVILVKRLPTDPILAQRRAQALASQVRQLIARSFNISAHTFNLSASVGITIVDHSEQLLPEQHLKRVSLALAQVKENGRDGVVVYSREMDLKAERNLLIRTELVHAIDREQLSLVYQPVVNTDGNVVSVEALLRWKHPQHGSISPAEFIPIAEGSDLINEIGHWVVLEVCRFIQLLEKQSIEPPMISINVSSRQFNQHEFSKNLLNTLQEQKIQANNIELELTEYALLTDIDQVRQSMSVLREAGVSIALDDFGTGYSSLSYLQGLPLNRLKLDASFIRDMGNGETSGAIVKAMIDMAHSLDLQFVAEGVEIQSQHDQLAAYQCDLYQGYLFHRPMMADKLKALISAKAKISSSAM